MLLIRCTAKVLNLIGMSKTELPAVELDPAEGSCFANLIRPVRRNWLLLTHSTTRYSFVVLDVRSAELDDLTLVFLEHLAEAFGGEGIASAESSGLLARYGDSTIAKTNSRSALGSMVDLAFLIEASANPYGNAGALDVTELTRRLNRTPMSAIGYAHAIDKMKRLLQDCAT
jgi:hypothetical protein